MSQNSDKQFRLGKILVSPWHNELSQGDTVLQVQPRVMAVLVYLAENHQRVIGNDELIEQVWEGRVVTHGSVQKSINFLRKALTELDADPNLVTHYSKKGYQLQLAPEYVDTPPAARGANHRSSRRPALLAGIGLALLALLIGFIVLLRQPGPTMPEIRHTTQFNQTLGYTNETGHERSPTPHPAKPYVAYVADTSNAGEPQSRLVIRGPDGEDWLLASSEHPWSTLAWSPNGRALAVVEKLQTGLSADRGFYATNQALYNIHVFEPDLENKQLLEKHRLSHWQGQINSLAWPDENTVEIVARQGQAPSAQRFHYNLPHQQLQLMSALEIPGQLIASARHGELTAIVSRHNEQIRLDLLDNQQQSFHHIYREASAAEISWLPDGTGVLLFLPASAALEIIYINGKVTTVEFSNRQDVVHSHPRYANNGQHLYYGESRPQADIWLQAQADTHKRLTQNNEWNYGARFSPTGDTIAYVSVRNNQTHIWLMDSGSERQLTRREVTGRIRELMWSDNQSLLYSTENQVWLQPLSGEDARLLMADSDGAQPVAYFPDSDALLVKKQQVDSENFWLFDTRTQSLRQLTFGSVGGVVLQAQNLLFQYIGQPGLWQLNLQEDTPRKIEVDLPANIKPLHANQNFIYFVTGAPCGESNIQRIDMRTGNIDEAFAATQDSTNTLDYHPARGVLYNHCLIPESDIMVLTSGRPIPAEQ